ncbi:hypothetical protein [Chitinophaga niabensis]|uniref:Uncharacterized protein n=1 Tax=Chitinophaga niabensis TaxID=536979 RepID=A0A1N6KC96_9BACT|nr:hypothetical protein [Chitinophaga niabensis]SIO53947.1 hypothetical protein SAMN04488055_5510 [Chitinophaga niabensis]
MRQMLNAIFKVVIDSDLSTNEVIKELKQSLVWQISSTENVSVKSSKWLETTYFSSENQDGDIQITPEYAKSNLGFEDDIKCICEHDIIKDPFWPCDEAGSLVNPNLLAGPYHGLCQNCGRILDSKSLRFIGRRNVDNIDEELENTYN